VSYITVLDDGDGPYIRGFISGRWVSFWMSDYPNSDGSGCERFYGCINPESHGHWFWRKTEPTVWEALEDVVAHMHRQQFMKREAEAQVDTARATMRAMAELERELLA